MRQTKEVSIDGHKFRIGLFDPVKSISILTRLVKLSGGSLGKFTGMAFKAKKEAENNNTKKQANDINILDLDVDTVSDSLSLIIENIEENKVQKLIDDILTQAQHTGTDSGEEGRGNCVKAKSAIFTGETFLLFKVVYAVLQENYSDFLGERAQS